MFDDQQGIARVAQPVKNPDQPADVAGMKAYARFVEYEQSVDKRCPEGRGEIDPLHFAAAQGS